MCETIPHGTRGIFSRHRWTVLALDDHYLTTTWSQVRYCKVPTSRSLSRACWDWRLLGGWAASMVRSSVEDMLAHASVEPVSLPRPHPPFRGTQLSSASQRWGPRFGPLSLAGHLPAGLQGTQKNGCGQCVAPGRSLLDPWAGRSTTLARPLGVTRGVLQPHFGFSGQCGSPEPASRRAAGLLARPASSLGPHRRRANRVQAVGGWRARLTGDAEASAFLAN